MTRPDQESVDCYQKEHGVLETHTKTQVRTRHDLSLVYTPGVAEICRRIRDGRESAFTCTMKANTVAIVTDGSAILGMGDLGPYPAIPVMEGKALLYREFAGIDAIPICLDAGQTPLPRLISRIAPVFGAIDLEDIAAPRCFALEDELRDLGIPVLHSDQHATAVVVLAALINACRVTGKRFADLQVVIAGAGASGTAIARLLKCVGMESDSCSPVADLIVCDRKGIIHRGRPDTFDTPHKYLLAHETNSENRQGDLGDALVGADAFIGAAAPGIVTGEMVRSMARDPIVFALANPEPEIEPADAIRAGAGIIATGKNTFPHQCNYVLAFPGIFRGALDARATRVTTGAKIAAARALADSVSALRKDRILPSILNRKVTEQVATAVTECIVREGCVRD